MTHRKPHPRIVVVAGDSWSSRAIEGFGAGRWAHMANILTRGAVLPDGTLVAPGTILDSRDNEIVYRGAVYDPGVQLRPATYLDAQPRWAIFEAPEPHGYDRWAAAGISQLGKPYDSIGILDFAEGLITGRYEDRNWASKHSRAWFCDELCTWMAMESGDIPRIPFPPFTLTPGAALNFFIGAHWRLIASRGLKDTYAA